ncbi:beta-carotene 15,15'-monooxygenase [Rubrobacter marinus]|uniref:Probable beta-carotene 15,15'-dioxygenase n=1 Tax=Rubrobacter marinus TaxID=2653852 RepID=A0A6G8Q2H8_9ACTN|nr:beta-carotene 15,15'-monooxygenase [Rubrobacter marinus]
MGVSEAARRTVRRRVLWPSWGLISVAALLFAAGLEVPGWAEYAPFALSFVLFGLPHGALDHLAVPRLLGREPWPWPVLAVGLLYLVLGGLYLALWFVSPVAAFAFFISLTWFHWGGGDLHALVAFVPEGLAYPADRTHRALVAVARGGLPMLVPLLAHPESYRAVAESTVGLILDDASGLSWPFAPGFRLYAGVSFALLVAVALAYGYVSAKGRGSLAAWRVDAAETALLAAYFALVPPVLAVGLYFCLWHAPRHIARLVLLDGASAVALEGGRLPLARFFRDAAPLTLAALALLLGLYATLPGTGTSAAALLALYLVLISVLTLPHVVVVSFMDLEQGLWSRET